MSDRNERACPECGSLLHYSCATSTGAERAFGIKYAAAPGVDSLTGTPAEKHDPTTGELTFEPNETPDRGWDPVTRSLTSMDGLAWAARKYREVEDAFSLNERAHEAEVAWIQRDCDQRMAAAEERRAAADKPLKPGRQFFEGVMAAYAETHRAEVLAGLRKDAKSRLFPSGVRIGWEKIRDGYFWDDSMPAAERTAKLLEWAKMRPGLTETREVPDLEAIKKHLAAADRVNPPERIPGTPAPGMKYVEPGETLEIVVKEKP